MAYLHNNDGGGNNRAQSASSTAMHQAKFSRQKRHGDQQQPQPRPTFTQLSVAIRSKVLVAAHTSVHALLQAAFLEAFVDLVVPFLKAKSAGTASRQPAAGSRHVFSNKLWNGQRQAAKIARVS